MYETGKTKKGYSLTTILNIRKFHSRIKKVNRGTYSPVSQGIKCKK